MTKRKRIFTLGVLLVALFILSSLAPVLFPAEAATGVTANSGVITQGVDGTAAVKASVALNGLPNLMIEANTPGIAGNNIVINFTRFGGIRPVEGMITSVVGNEINYLYYSGGSNTTLSNVMTVINAHPEANQLVTATGGDATNLQEALINTFGGLQDVYPVSLAGGADGSGVNEVFQINITNPAVSNGNINFDISGSIYSIGILNGDTESAIANNLNLAINNNPVPGYANSVLGNSLILTSTVLGNVPDLTVSLTEVAFNEPPVIDYIVLGSPVYEEDVATITTVAYDPNGDPLTYSINDPNFIETATPGVLEWQTEIGDSQVNYGIYNSIISVSDGINIVTKAVDILVLDPAISLPIPPFFSTYEPASYDIEVGKTLTFKKVVGSLSPLLNIAITNLPAGAEQIFLGNGEILFRWTPTIGDVGSYVLNFLATDEFGSAEANVTINILNQVNNVPVINNISFASPITEGDLSTIAVGASDADGDNLTYSISNPSFSQNNPGVFTWQTAIGSAGTYNMTVTVNDGIDSTTQNIQLTVSPQAGANNPPVINDISFNTPIAEGVTATIYVSATDADGDALTYSINNPNFTQSPFLRGVFIWGTVIGDAGTYDLTISVSDGIAVTNQNIQLVVSPQPVINHPPVLDLILSRTISENFLSEFTITANDVDGDPLTFSSTDLPLGATLDPVTGAFSWRPAIGQAGVYFMTFIVSDGSLSDSQLVRITVTTDTIPPVITLLGLNQMAVTQNTVFTDPGVTAMDDVDGDITANVVVTGTVDTATLGTYVLIYDVTDSSGNVAVSVARRVNVVVSTGTNITISLSAGWNMVALPNSPIDQITGQPINYTAETFGQLAGADVVTEWQSASQQYNSHIVGFPLNDFNITENMGFFVHVPVAINVTIYGTPIQPAAFTVNLGWNFLGWNDQAPTTAEALGLSITGADVVSKFDGSTQLWSSHIINFPLNDFAINNGDGVFVHKP